MRKPSINYDEVAKVTRKVARRCVPYGYRQVAQPLWSAELTAAQKALQKGKEEMLQNPTADKVAEYKIIEQETLEYMRVEREKLLCIEDLKPQDNRLWMYVSRYNKPLPPPKNSNRLLLNILNKSLKTGDVPRVWKTGHIIPIPKPNKSLDDIESFRPITLTSHVAKIIERMVAHRVLHMIEGKINPTQFGFQRGKSTTDALASLVETYRSPNSQLLQEKAELQNIQTELHAEEHKRAEAVKNTMEKAVSEQLQQQAVEFELMKAAHKREMD